MKTGDHSAPFFTRPFVNGKQIWKTLLAQSFKEAKEEANNLAVALHARSKGLTVSEAESLTRFRGIYDESRADDGLLQFVSHFPFVCIASKTPGDACWKIALVRRERDVICVSRIGAAVCGC